MSGSLAELGFWEDVLASGFRLAVPLGLAAAGELMSERAGVLNLGLEGTMAVGAFGGIAGAAAAGPGLGLLVGAGCGALAGLLFAVLAVHLRINEIVVGFGLTLGGTGLASFLFRSRFEQAPDFAPFRAVRLPGLSGVPMLGPFLFAQPLVVWLLPAVVTAMAVLLRRTSAGLALRAAGEEPSAARARGVRVGLVRTAATVGGGALAGLGGAVLTAGLVGEFSDEVVGGRGWLALALVIVAGWRPTLLVPAALLVGSLQAFYLRAQAATDLGLPVPLLQALPFVVTLAVLSARASSARAPAALGRLTAEGS